MGRFARKRSSFQDNMGIKEISIAGSENVKVDLAPIDELKATTQCCCTACSFYTKWPECCGVNESNMLCCCSTELGFGCFQYKDEHKKIQSVVSTSTCLDYTGEKTIWHEAATEVIACFCIKGASKAWCGVSDCDPFYTQGNSLCIDNRCALPPSDETVPLGIACCGMQLCGKGIKESSADSGGGGGGGGDAQA